jgi:plasmid stability protein
VRNGPRAGSGPNRRFDFDDYDFIDYNEITRAGNVSMSSITIRNLDPAIKERLRVRAAERGRSMEAEARRILQAAFSGRGRPSGPNLYERIHARFATLGGVNLELSRCEPAREPPRFD